MKLARVHVTNFRCILDSDPVDIGPTTCLVGKNESGKTAFLQALEGLRPVHSSDSRYKKLEDYPRRFYAEYDERHGGDDAEVVSTVWKLDENDRNDLETRFGEESITGDEVTISKRYGEADARWSVPVDETSVLESLARRYELSEEERGVLEGVDQTRIAGKRLGELEQRTESQWEILKEISEYRDCSASLAAIDLLEERTPRFLYFSHYDRMSGEVSINQLNRDQMDKGIQVDDQVFLDFLEYAGTNLDELARTNRFEEMNARCEAAANRITDQIFEYWTQNDQLAIKVILGEGKPADEAPFNAGTVARARVENLLHRVTSPFSERSAGFIWFFSFLARFAQIRKTHRDVIILLDEPGLTLHGTAQKDLLRYFRQELEPHHQIIYTTHSPFLVPADNLASVRTVEEVVRRDKRNRPVSEGTKIRADVLTTDPQTSFPVLGAMGFEVTQGLMIAPDTLLVEGPADILYLQALSRKLESSGRVHLDPKWAMCPSGGIDKVLPFVRLFYGNDLNTVVLTDFDRGQTGDLDDLYKSGLLERERIILASEIAGQTEADIEDFFAHELLVELINRTFQLAAEDRLTVAKLMTADENTERAVKKAEAYFRLLPDRTPMFSRYSPALYLLRNPELLEGNEPAVEQTLDTFEEAFRRIEKYARRWYSPDSWGRRTGAVIPPVGDG